MKKKLLCAVAVFLIPVSLLATPIRIGTGTPTVLEVCTGGTEPSNTTLISFANHTSNTVTITAAQLPGIITPVSIPPNGTVTFKVPASPDGTYDYTVDGCQ